MRLMKIFCAFLFLLVLPTTSAYSKKKQVPQVYMFGVSSSFNDSTVYFTNIQELDSAWADEKSKFLSNREDYAYQLKDFFNERRESNRTCVVFYAYNRKDIDKKYTKLKNKYMNQKKKHFHVEDIASSDFSFHAVKPDLVEIVDDPKIVKEKKKSAKKEKTNKEAYSSTREPDDDN